MKKGLFLCLWAILLTNCAHTPSDPFYTRLYAGTYDEIWDATLKAVREYPLKFTNKDGGKIQTEVVNGPYNELVFNYPEAIELPERFRFSVKIQLAKVSPTNSSEVVRVRITKELERFTDFYAGWTPYSPDGIEERVILYRLAHIHEMQSALASRRELKPDTKTDE